MREGAFLMRTGRLYFKIFLLYIMVATGTIAFYGNPDRSAIQAAAAARDTQQTEAAEPDSEGGPVVDTHAGKVRGTRSESGIYSFLGVPYAAPPVADLRFMPPRRHAGWDDVRDATEYGATAPQLPSGEPLAGLYPNVMIPGDDYLNLNIWTRDLNGKQPVMVFIHGGSFISGSGAIAGYDGSSFARDGVVLVTINYRLGADGFLWFGEGEANLGLLDQIAALEWVRDNIEAFGGDPSSVTLFGESAGASSIGTLLAMPSADGLFRRAIMESGTAEDAVSVDSAKAVANQLADILGVARSREAIAEVSTARLLEAQKKVDGDQGLPFVPVIDGKTLKESPIAAIEGGASAEIDLMVGNNSEEAFLLFAPQGKMHKVSKLHFYLAAYTLRVPALKAADVYYNARSDARDVDVVNDLITDAKYRIPSILLAQSIPNSYVYEFSWHSPAFDDELGAAHGVELPFVFDHITSQDWHAITGGVAPQELASEVHRAWVNFAKTGNPGWEAYTADKRVVKMFGTDSKVVENPHAAATQFWQELSWEGSHTNPNAGLLAAGIGIVIGIPLLLIGLLIFMWRRRKKRRQPRKRDALR
ncbi:carboxylesterase family protein [Paenibacillus sp. IB182496]|uniref:Carboxylic ester hydrolase n=1 Tax=Paenibacillus sabuli TaxID=2772509 RepID=A0A927GSI1_9BACL|nr:carboxylesterase family protein [Paenibacillus sabuli]MBD2846588.1 carboxylesterase family protein [Paenibacillus sabuli]